MKFFRTLERASMITGTALPKNLDISSPDSICHVASTLAYDAMSYYTGNETGKIPWLALNAAKERAYWWTEGALFGTMLDYYHNTNDPSYNQVVIDALTSSDNLGANMDYVPLSHRSEEGNDDLAFWGTTVLTAAGMNFPQPDRNVPSWLQLGDNVFNSLVSRWNTTDCGGGLLWQIYPDNPNGLTYKNSISNGGLFQIAARLGRFTDNHTYYDWADKVWDWADKVGFLTEDGSVLDGMGIDTCKPADQSFPYLSGIWLYGAAVMANATGEDLWLKRTEKLLDGAVGRFFGHTKKLPNVMYQLCEYTEPTCNYDQVFFKGFLARWMWHTTVMVPSLRTKIETYLHASAKAVTKACTGGKDHKTCGMKWYTGGYDGNPGVGAETSALETIQGLLVHNAPAPLKGKDIKTVRSTD